MAMNLEMISPDFFKSDLLMMVFRINLVIGSI